jgi:hypothetical protein
MPPIAVGQVLDYLPWNGGLKVQFRNAQIFGGANGVGSVTMGYDNASPYTIDQKPLPLIGSWILAAFPNADSRNGVFLCAYNAISVDAITTQASDASGAHMAYRAHWSGHWHQLDGRGQEAVQWPDGSFWVSNASGSLPTTFRNIVVSGLRTQIPLTHAQRVPNPPAPFFKTLVAGPSGSPTTVSIDPSGNVSVSGSANATLTLSINGISFTMALSTFTASASNFVTTENLVAGNGTSGSFTTPTGQVVTVQDGIITNIF